MKGLSRFIFNQILGWRLIGEFPDLKKYIIIVVPHTSWHDFYIGVLVRSMVGIPMNFVGKKELFNSPFGWYFRWMGGEGVDRSKNSNTVDAVVDIFEKREEFRLALAPEGTRKKVSSWKTGFYYIAKGAGVPIIMAAFDYGRKEVRLSEPFYPTADSDKDIRYLYAWFKGVEGKVKANSFES
ncbi:lysophospholipid acyltransferase family protein [Robertkochia solimangrovi]|uniref:lysophospholipid acyltransferase family protein n=1 Tax=Robertkochia solimangrovi TaxID=2213046 RepID=UPI0011802F83|nr:lysophospholipid acyltransferase family protein [Robertkochia solimangrovi]TRZ42901.1 acyltransferase [Robertkochia solimangrovi]